MQLRHLGYVHASQEVDTYNNSSWTAYRLTPAGEEWLLNNQDQLELQFRPSLPRGASKVEIYDGLSRITDDDVPF